jgi:hypothetical protein
VNSKNYAGGRKADGMVIDKKGTQSSYSKREKISIIDFCLYPMNKNRHEAIYFGFLL